MTIIHVSKIVLLFKYIYIQYKQNKNLLWRGAVKFPKKLEILPIIWTRTEIELEVIVTNLPAMTSGEKVA